MSTSSVTSREPSVEDVEKYNTEKLIDYLQSMNFLVESELQNVRIQKLDGFAFVNMTKDEFCASPFNIPYGPAKRVGLLIDKLNNQRLLTINEVLSCIPPPANYPLDTSTSISSTTVYGAWPTKIARWNEFLTEVNRYNFFEQYIFKRPQFFHGVQIVVETNVYTAMEVNIFGVLNEVMKKYMFAMQKDSDFSRNNPNIGPFVPDYTCRLKINNTFMKKILALEIKRDILLRDLVGLTDEKLERQDFSSHSHDIIRQIYNYMSSLQLQYGILSSYDIHFFLYRPKHNHTELHISHPLQRVSINPPVLKSYAYLAQLAEEDSTSPHHNIMNSSSQNLALQQSQQNFGGGQILRSLNNSRYNLRSMSRTSENRGSRENQDPMEHIFDCSEFKFERSLGYGQTGGTYQCEFHGQIIALKALDLYKNRKFFYKMQNEIEVYNLLSKVQGIYIPKLVCYGYYGGGMGYVMGMTIVGTILNFHKIEEWQKDMALKALKIIHSHNVLHNDIRKENILVNEKGNVYFIDFGKSIVTDKKELFLQEESELSRLFDCYM